MSSLKSTAEMSGRSEQLYNFLGANQPPLVYPDVTVVVGTTSQ